MGRKVALSTALVLVAVMSVVLVGGQVGGGFLWWGDHDPIYIYGDDDFTYRNGVMSGTGTAEDPYIIEGWRIDAPNADYAIYIDHTTSYFVIRDCVIERARVAGVYFNTVRNGIIDNIQVSLSDNAVYFLNSKDNYLTESVIADCRYGVIMAAGSQDNKVAGNAFIDNGLHGHDPQRRNRWYDESGGNFWSDYSGMDTNGDGIGDEPYYPLWDSRPLMISPVERADVQPAGFSYAGNQVSPDGSLVVTSQTPISLTAADPGSGLAEIRYAIDGGEWLVFGDPILLTGEDGPRKITYYGVDNLGNAEPKSTVAFLLDNHPPKTAYEVGTPKFVNEQGTWITSSTRISLRRVQESTYGISKTYYRIDGGGWQRYSAPFVILGYDGPHKVSFYSQNASGVTEPVQTVTLFKDDAPPATRGAQASSPASAIDVVIGPAPSSTVKPTTPAVEKEPEIVETPVVEKEPVAEEAPVVEESAPPAETAVVSEPVEEAPVVAEPVEETPVVAEPVEEAPVVSEPVDEAPALTEPAEEEAPAEVVEVPPVVEVEIPVVDDVQTPSDVLPTDVQTDSDVSL